MVKQTIAIVGADGDMGSAISQLLANAPVNLRLIGHDEKVLKKLSRSLKKISPDMELDTQGCAREACWESDIIILSEPISDVNDQLSPAADVLVQKILVNVFQPGTIAAREIEKRFPYSRQVSAFYTNNPEQLKQPRVEALTCMMAGNDPEALEQVLSIIKMAGLQPILETSE